MHSDRNRDLDLDLDPLAHSVLCQNVGADTDPGWIWTLIWIRVSRSAFGSTGDAYAGQIFRAELDLDLSLVLD